MASPLYKGAGTPEEAWTEGRYNGRYPCLHIPQGSAPPSDCPPPPQDIQLNRPSTTLDAMATLARLPQKKFVKGRTGSVHNKLLQRISLTLPFLAPRILDDGGGAVPAAAGEGLQAAPSFLLQLAHAELAIRPPERLRWEWPMEITPPFGPALWSIFTPLCFSISRMTPRFCAANASLHSNTSKSPTVQAGQLHGLQVGEGGTNPPSHKGELRHLRP